MASVTKDIVSHLLADPAIVAVVESRGFAVQVPDNQRLPYFLVEKPLSTTVPLSKGRLVESDIVIMSFAATAGEAEALAELVDARMEVVFTSTLPAVTVDAFPGADDIASEENRGKDGILRFSVSLMYLAVRHLPDKVPRPVLVLGQESPAPNK